MEHLNLYTVVHHHPQGWRWAIHTDDQFHLVGFGHLGSAIEATQAQAEGVLSMVLSVVRCALTVAGVPTQIVAHTLADCPLTADIVGEIARAG